jgi:UDP-3-O-[3-hydroxymyristoyl] glucosamine N-acyltransferase
MKLKELGHRIDAEVRGDGDVEITGVAGLDDAEPGALSFLSDPKHAHKLATTRASAVVVRPDAPDAPMPTLRAPNPYLAFVRAVELFHPPQRPPSGIHPSAVVDATASIGAGAAIGPGVVVGARAVLGPDATLHPNVTIYDGARIGAAFTAHAGAVVREGVVIGDRVVLHAGAVVGSDGFGYIPLPDRHHRIPQIGTVELGDDVEIGANATVDRATLGVTRVGAGTKIDNLVMVGHNCEIGERCMLAGQVGLAGSTRLGDLVLMGGQAGAGGHLTIGAGTMIAAQTGIHKDIPAGAAYGGYPAMEVRRWRRVTMSIPRVPELFRRIRRLEKAAGMEPERDED